MKARVCLDIQTGALGISDDYFLTCFYPKGHGDPNNVEQNFLRSGLLVKVCFQCVLHIISLFSQTFCSIFTSPTSSESFDTESDDGPSRKKLQSSGQKKATKCNVATLLHMDSKVTPRAIAYAASIVNALIFLVILS